MNKFFPHDSATITTLPPALPILSTTTTKAPPLLSGNDKEGLICEMKQLFMKYKLIGHQVHDLAEL